MEIPRHWRLRKQRYQLLGETCPRCGEKSFPARSVCPHCQETENRIPQNHRLAVLIELTTVRHTA